MKPFEVAPYFGPEGPLARAIPGYRHRPQQVEFAQAVQQAIEGPGVLIAEAGTGTGKTFAYLVPALLAGGRVIVSTGTKNLQDQLFHRDLPRVRAALGVPVDLALLKGRANYVCLHHMEIAAAEGQFGTREEASHIHKIKRFAKTTMTGDRAECLDVPETSGAWSRATSTRENCLGSACKQYQECFVMKARKRATEADVVVVNHHLFFADVVLRDEGAADLLPAANTVIFDEAHHLPDLARLFFGQAFSTAQAVELARDAKLAAAMHAKESPDLQDAATAVDRGARDVRIALGKTGGRIPIAGLATRAAFDGALDALAERLSTLARLLTAHEERAEELKNARLRAEEFRGRIVEWREADGREREEGPVDTVRWLEAFAGTVVLYITPLDVAAIFNAQVKDSKRAWIFTSATLSVAGDFSHYQAEMGLAQAVTRSWPSPFDFATQALLYAPEGMPDPNSEGYTDAVVDAAWPVVEASAGRAFLLFTSLRAMERGCERFKAKLEEAGLDWPVLLQGTGSKNELLERFRVSPHAVLFGSQSFWEGVDVKGEQLSVVVIDRLPFNPPDDPVLAACLERINRAGGNAFMEYQVPRAVIALKQGAGRLIRDETDRGVLMIADPRLTAKPYGRRIWRALPPFRRTRAISDVEAFFSSGTAEPGTASLPGTTSPSGSTP